MAEALGCFRTAGCPNLRPASTRNPKHFGPKDPKVALPLYDDGV